MPYLAEQRSRCSGSADCNISDISIISVEIVTPGMVFGVILKAFGIILVSSGTMGRLLGGIWKHTGGIGGLLGGIWKHLGSPGPPLGARIGVVGG